MANALATQNDAAEQASWGLPTKPPASPMLWWTALGTLVLVATVGLILFTARRSERAESRGDDLANLLLREGKRMVPIDWHSEWQRMHAEAALFAAALACRVSVSELEESRGIDGVDEFRFVNKHYAIALRPSQNRDPELPSDEGDWPLECVAFPRALVSPAKAVFFHPEDADAVYSRNLQHDYCDEEAKWRPAPGMLHRQHGARWSAFSYRAYDDERFLVPLRER